MPDTTRHEQLLRAHEQEGVVRSHRPDPAVLARLLDEWMRGDEREQRETFESLRRSLDEDRPAGYKLFS